MKVCDTSHGSPRRNVHSLGGSARRGEVFLNALRRRVCLTREAAAPAAAVAYSPKRGETSAIAAISSANLTATTPMSGSQSPIAARAGHQAMLARSGACAGTALDCNTLTREIVP